MCKRIGISNFEEYSLVREDGVAPATSSPGLTRKASKIDKKLEKIKKNAKAVILRVDAASYG